MHKLHILIWNRLLGKNGCFNFDKFLTVLYEIEGAGGTLLSYVFKFKSVNLRYITMGRLDDDMTVPPSDGAMFILIDWE